MPKTTAPRILDLDRNTASITKLIGGGGSGNGGGGTGDYVPLSRTITGDSAIRVNGVTTATLAANIALSLLLKGSGGLAKDVNGLYIELNSTGGLGYSSGMKILSPTNSGITVNNTGIYITPATITVTTTPSTNTPAAGVHSHNIDSASSVTTAVAKILQTDTQGALTVVKLTAPTVTTTTVNTATGGLTLNAVTDVTLSPTQEIILNAGTYTVLPNDNEIRTTSFATGFGGNGASLSHSTSTGKTTFEVDNLWVRGTMHVYELLVHQIRATNGAIYVTSTGKVKTVAGGPSSFVITSDDDHGFLVGDLIRSQRWTGTGIHQSNMTVTVVTDTKQFTAVLLSGSDPPVVGYDYVRLGNTTDVNRQGGIYMTADDSGAPYMDVYDDVNAWVQTDPPTKVLWGTAESIKLRLGNLRGSYNYATAGSKVYGFATGNLAKAYVSVDDTYGFRIRHNTTTRFEVTPAGDVHLRNSDGVATISLFTSGNSEFTGTMTFGPLGEIRQGHYGGGAGAADGGGSFDEMTNYTGLRIWRDGSYGRIAGYGAGNMQWSSEPDGSIGAGYAQDVGVDGIPIVDGSGQPVIVPMVKLHERGLSINQLRGIDYGIESIEFIQNAISWFDDPDVDPKPAANIVAGVVGGPQFDNNPMPFMEMSIKGLDPGDQAASISMQQRTTGTFFWFNNFNVIAGIPGIYVDRDAANVSSVIIGSAPGDYFTIAENVTTRIGGHWIPSSSFTKNLGSDTYRWNLTFTNRLDVKIIDSHLTPTMVAPTTATVSSKDLGTASARWRTLYSNNIVSNAASITNLYISFSGPIQGLLSGEGPTLYDEVGPGDLVVEGNIYVGGSTIGGASSGAQASIEAHAALPDVHHPQMHGLSDATHHDPASTLSWSRVNKTGSSIADLTTRSHGDLTGITADQHHSKSHPFIAGDHTISGLTAGHVLRATSPTAYSFGTLDPSVIENFDATVRALFSVVDSASIDMAYNSSNGQFSAAVYPTYVKSLFSASDSSTIEMTYNEAAGDFSGIVIVGAIDHNALANLDVGDFHTQYVHLDNARIIHAVHHFEPLVSSAPFTLGSNAYEVTVPGLRADQVDRYINAGDGTEGGGPLHDDVTISVLAGNMITVSGAGVSFADAPGPGHMVISLLDETPIWQPISYLAGQGLLHTNGVLDVMSDDLSLLVGTNDVKVNTDHAFTWTEPHIFQDTVAVQSNLTTYHVLPSLTDTWDIGSPTTMYRASWISTMNAVIFAENTAQLIGGWFIIPKYAGKLGPVTSGQTVIDLGPNTGSIISTGQVILVRAHTTAITPTIAAEYMTIGTNAGGNTWNVTRDVSGGNTPDPEWPDGTPYLLLGTTNDARIELDAQNTPRISLIRQASAAYNSGEEVVRIGDLNTTFGYVAQTWGFTLGKYGVATNSWVAFDLTNGFRIGNNVTQLGHWATTGNVAIGDVGSTNLYITSTALQFRVGTVAHGTLTSTSLVLGQNLSGRTRIEVDSTNGFRIIFQNGATPDTKMQIDISGNASFDGRITATSGSIGGWSIATGLISATNIGLYSGVANTARIEVGVGSTSGGINSANTNTATLATGVVFWAGDTHALRNTADFRVYTTGALFANNTTLSGTLNVTAGLTTLGGPVTLSSTLTVAGTITWSTGRISSGEGVTLVATTSGSVGRAFRIMEPADVNELAKMSAYKSGANNIGDILVANVGLSGNATLNIDANATNGYGTINIQALSTGTVNDVRIVMNDPVALAAMRVYISGVERLEVNTAGVAVTGAFSASGAASFTTTVTATGTITGGTLSTAGNVNAAAGSFTSVIHTTLVGSSGAGAIGWSAGAGMYKLGTRVALTGDTSWGMYCGDGRAFFPTGTAALPSISFDAYATTGFYAFTTGIGFATAGTVAMTLNSANSLYCYGSITSATTVQGLEGYFTTGGVTANAGGSPNTYTPYRFNDVHGTGMAGSPGAYVGIAVGGQWALLSRQDANSSGLYLGIGNANSAAAIVSFYTDGAAPTSAQAYINRVAGPNGNFGIVNAGTGGININTGGVNVFNLVATAVVAVVKIHLPDGGVGGPSITWSSDPDTGFYKTAVGSFRMAAQGVDIGAFVVNGTAGQLGLACGDNTTGSGAFITLARNGNATTPAAGNIRIVDRGGTNYWIHPDDAGVLRIGTTTTYGVVANDTANAAVGSQTSTLDTKDILGLPVEGSIALDYIKGGAEAVRRFQYKAIDPHDDEMEAVRPYGGEEFSGMVVDWAPRYGTDADAAHPNGRSLNLINSIGDLMIGTTHLSSELTALQHKVEDLEKEIAELKAAQGGI